MDGRRIHERTNAQKNNVALAHPYHEGKWLIPPGSLVGACRTDGRTTDAWTDGRTEKVLLSHTLTIRGSEIESLVEFRLVV